MKSTSKTRRITANSVFRPKSAKKGDFGEKTSIFESFSSRISNGTERALLAMRSVAPLRNLRCWKQKQYPEVGIFDSFWMLFIAIFDRFWTYMGFEWYGGHVAFWCMLIHFFSFMLLLLPLNKQYVEVIVIVIVVVSIRSYIDRIGYGDIGTFDDGSKGFKRSRNGL